MVVYGSYNTPANRLSRNRYTAMKVLLTWSRRGGGLILAGLFSSWIRNAAPPLCFFIISILLDGRRIPSANQGRNEHDRKFPISFNNVEFIYAKHRDTDKGYWIQSLPDSTFIQFLVLVKAINLPESYCKFCIYCAYANYPRMLAILI